LALSVQGQGVGLGDTIVGVTTDELRKARQAWAHAHIELDTCLTKLIPAALAADARGGEELQQLLTPEQSHDIAGLYGAAIGAWARYRELLRHAGETQD
jgi:hypothetical protein